MPYSTNNGVRIHYEVEGSGPPLVLQHGGTSSLENTRDFGWVCGLKDSYRLILMDARGHGASDKPHDPPAYRAETMASDVVAVLDQEGIRRTHYHGYSMGGRIGFALAKIASQRLVSLIIGGMHPYSFANPYSPPKQVVVDWQAQQVRLFRRGMTAWVTAMESQGAVFDATERARQLNNDSEALAALFEAVGAMTSMEDVLPTMKIPCLL